jgi:hypothetical protein
MLILHSGRHMGQVLHGSATTTHAIRAAIQRFKFTLTMAAYDLIRLPNLLGSPA